MSISFRADRASSTNAKGGVEFPEPSPSSPEDTLARLVQLLDAGQEGIYNAYDEDLYSADKSNLENSAIRFRREFRGFEAEYLDQVVPLTGGDKKFDVGNGQSLLLTELGPTPPRSIAEAKEPYFKLELIAFKVLSLYQDWSEERSLAWMYVNERAFRAEVDEVLASRGSGGSNALSSPTVAELIRFVRESWSGLGTRARREAALREEVSRLDESEKVAIALSTWWDPFIETHLDEGDRNLFWTLVGE